MLGLQHQMALSYTSRLCVPYYLTQSQYDLETAIGIPLFSLSRMACPESGPQLAGYPCGLPPPLVLAPAQRPGTGSGRGVSKHCGPSACSGPLSGTSFQQRAYQQLPHKAGLSPFSVPASLRALCRHPCGERHEWRSGRSGVARQGSGVGSGGFLEEMAFELRLESQEAVRTGFGVPRAITSVASFGVFVSDKRNSLP